MNSGGTDTEHRSCCLCKTSGFVSLLSDLILLKYLIAGTNAEMLLALSSPEFLQEVSRA